uniref:t-SNARE coiled-coil homology domain-containing protein n=1 Tax=Arcella intermedia TaxID=1963864 RepID=A0A6B2LF07_9EUKA
MLSKKKQDKPKWLLEVENIELSLEDLRNRGVDLENLTDDLPTIEGLTEKKKEIEAKMFEFRIILQECSDKIKNLGSSKMMKKEEASLRDHIKSHLASKLQNISIQFKNTEIVHSSTNATLEKKGFGSILDDDPSNDYEEGFLAHGDIEMMKVNVDQRTARERNKAVRNLAQTMMEISSLFNEVSEMVIQQGTLVDRIDQNITTADDYVIQGVNSLTQTKGYESSSAKCWIVFLVILTIVSIVMIIIIRAKRVSY